jgi:DNA-binding transcriptional ArsR family regulator
MRIMAEIDQPRYLALIGDIRGSRSLPDRQAVQDRLQRTLAGLDRRFDEVIAARFAVTTGDEFQVLLRDPAAGIAVLVACDEALAGIALRFGLGWGPLATRLQPRAVGMDGPCFHAARLAIEWAKEQERWAAVRGLAEADAATLDGVLGLIGAVRAEWTDRQAELVALRREVATQRELAARLGLDPSTVSRHLKSAHHDEMVAAERAAGDLLARFARPPAVAAAADADPPDRMRGRRGGPA